MRLLGTSLQTHSLLGMAYLLTFTDLRQQGTILFLATGLEQIELLALQDPLFADFAQEREALAFSTWSIKLGNHLSLSVELQLTTALSASDSS